MILHPAGREYATWPVVEAPEGATIEASFDDGTTWHAMEHDVAANEARILVAGPQATGSPADTVTLPLGTSMVSTRVSDSPEDVRRPAGFITVTEASY